MRATVRAELLDGTTQEGTGPIFTLGDRVAFEQHFRISSAGFFALLRHGGPMDEEGKFHDVPGNGETHWAFWGYLLLRRTGSLPPGQADGQPQSFEEWADSVDDLSFQILKKKGEEEEPNPTEPDPRSGPSPS